MVLVLLAFTRVAGSGYFAVYARRNSCSLSDYPGCSMRGMLYTACFTYTRIPPQNSAPLSTAEAIRLDVGSLLKNGEDCLCLTHV